MDWIEHRRWREGALALLPAEPDEVAGVRVWLALAELARFNPRPRGATRLTPEDREQVLVADLLEAEPDSADVTLVLATAQGLRAGLCESGGLTLTAARSALEGLLGDRVHVTSASRISLTGREIEPVPGAPGGRAALVAPVVPTVDGGLPDARPGPGTRPRPPIRSTSPSATRGPPTW